MASATAYDPPTWLRKYETKASFAFSPYERRTFTEAETIAAAFVNEVSILSPGTKPAEPLAQVMLIQQAAAPASARAAAPNLGDGRTVRRYGGQVLGVR